LITPNVDDVIKVAGSPKFGWLNKLKASARKLPIHLERRTVATTGGEFADFFDSSPRGRGGKMWRTVTQPAELHKPKGE
jgi:hypothetical protein